MELVGEPFVSFVLFELFSPNCTVLRFVNSMQVVGEFVLCFCLQICPPKSYLLGKSVYFCKCWSRWVRWAAATAAAEECFEQAWSRPRCALKKNHVKGTSLNPICVNLNITLHMHMSVYFLIVHVPSSIHL